jgi:hypothetical protein
MGNTTLRDHSVQRTETDNLVSRSPAAVVKVAAIQAPDSGEADKVVGPNIDTVTGYQLGRTGLIEEERLAICRFGAGKSVSRYLVPAVYA